MWVSLAPKQLSLQFQMITKTRAVTVPLLAEPATTFPFDRTDFMTAAAALEISTHQDYTDIVALIWAQLFLDELLRKQTVEGVRQTGLS